MAQGTVKAIYESKGFYRLQIDGDQRIFGLGKFKPSFAPGTVVSFEAEKNERGYWDAKNITEVVGAPVAPTKSYTSKPAQNAGLTKEEWALKDKIIQRQSCRNSAIETLGLMLQHGAVEIPKTKGKAYDAVLNFVNELTTAFEQHNDELANPKKEATVAEAIVAPTVKDEEIWN